MRSFLVITVAAIGCRNASPPIERGGSGSAAVAVALDAAVDAAPALPDGLRALDPAAPLPAIASGELLLLSGKPGTPVVLTGADGKPLAIPDGAIAKITDSYELVGGWKANDVDRAEVEAERGGAHTAQVVTRAEEMGDFPHHQVWFVPTVRTRVQLAEDASEILVDWSDPQHRRAVVMLDQKGLLIDVKTGAAQVLGDDLGSPSYAPDGTLYFRTLDGRAWRWTGDHAEKIGKGRRGKPQTGDLNDGIEPAVFPPPVTFDAAGKPAFK